MLLHYVTRLSRSVSGLLSRPSAQYKVHVFLVYWGISSSLRSHSVASGNCFPAWFTRCNKSGKAICNRLHLMVVGAASFRHRSAKKKKKWKIYVSSNVVTTDQCRHGKVKTVVNVSAEDWATRCNWEKIRWTSTKLKNSSWENINHANSQVLPRLSAEHLKLSLTEGETLKGALVCQLMCLCSLVCSTTCAVHWRSPLLVSGTGSLAASSKECFQWLTRSHPNPHSWCSDYDSFSISNPQQANEWQIREDGRGKMLFSGSNIYTFQSC